MNHNAAFANPLRLFFENLTSVFRAPPRNQIAALCYRNAGDQSEVLLITSRKHKRWIMPKGWPMENLTARKCAEREAYEEAGIVGKVGHEPLGSYYSFKGLGDGLKVKTKVSVFPLEVHEQLKDFPESGQREFSWLPVHKAAELCDEANLRSLLLSQKVSSLLKN